MTHHAGVFDFGIKNETFTPQNQRISIQNWEVNLLSRVEFSCTELHIVKWDKDATSSKVWELAKKGFDITSD